MVSEIGQLAVVCAWGRWTLNINTIDSLAFMFSLKIGRQCTPPPKKKWKSWIPGQGDILLLADVPPPPRNEKVGYQVNMTFWFWMMYPPPTPTPHPHPPPEIEIGLNMNAIGKKIISREVIKYILPNLPPPPHLPLSLSDFMPGQETGEFQFQMDWWTRTPSATPLQPKK